ncbi:hypothetical protein PAPHI01_1887 [Pancytospora philotis]|nr:hypothetical protein PAPHI01_1887 [Pancytospora philotis]
MYLRRIIVCPLVLSFVCGAAAEGRALSAGKVKSLRKVVECFSEMPGFLEDPTIDELYEHCKGMPFLDFFTQEARRMDPVSETEAKADAILLAWLAAEDGPKALKQFLVTARFSFLVTLRKILDIENVERVYESISPMRLPDPQQNCRSKWQSKRNAGVLLKALDTAISIHLDSADPCEFFKTRKHLEEPYDLFLHLYMRSHYKRKPLTHAFGALLKHLLPERASVYNFEHYALPFIQVLPEQKLVTGDAHTDLERVVLRVAATVSCGYVINIFKKVRFRTPHIDLFKECIIDKPDRYASPLFVQDYLHFCKVERYITEDEKIALFNRYYENDTFFKRNMSSASADKFGFRKLRSKFICYWIFKRFVVNYTDGPEHRAYLQSVLDAMDFHKLADVLCCAFSGRYETHIPFFLSLLSRKYLEEFDMFLCGLKVGSRYNQEFYFKLKTQICSIIQPELAPLNLPCESASPRAKKRRRNHK